MDRFVIQIQIFLKPGFHIVVSVVSVVSVVRKKFIGQIEFILSRTTSCICRFFCIEHLYGRFPYSCICPMNFFRTTDTTDTTDTTTWKPGLNVLTWDNYIRTRFSNKARRRKKKTFSSSFALLWVQTGAIAGLILSCMLQGAHYFPFSLRLRVSQVSLQALLSVPKWSLLCN